MVMASVIRVIKSFYRFITALKVISVLIQTLFPFTIFPYLLHWTPGEHLAPLRSVVPPLFPGRTGRRPNRQRARTEENNIRSRERSCNAYALANEDYYKHICSLYMYEMKQAIYISIFMMKELQERLKNLPSLQRL